MLTSIQRKPRGPYQLCHSTSISICIRGENSNLPQPVDTELNGEGTTPGGTARFPSIYKPSCCASKTRFAHPSPFTMYTPYPSNTSATIVYNRHKAQQFATEGKSSKGDFLIHPLNSYKYTYMYIHTYMY